MSDPVVHWGDAPAAVPLLGREHDVGILNAATERIARLVAITGAGGLGKSTLARVWAESVLERFEAVVWYGFKNRPPLTDAYHEIRQLLAPNDIIPSCGHTSGPWERNCVPSEWPPRAPDSGQS
jgi:hypothetical protein